LSFIRSELFFFGRGGRGGVCTCIIIVHICLSICPNFNFNAVTFFFNISFLICNLSKECFHLIFYM
jgi:hypothetical protein